MIDISANDINKFYGSNHILKGVSFEVYSGERIGLLGKNGSGKTTLFKIITEEESYDSGILSKASGKIIEMLAQIPVYDEIVTVEDVLRSSFKEATDTLAQMKRIEGDINPEVLEQYGMLMEEYERLGGYEIEVKLDKVCSGMDINERLRGSLFNLLSGGEKTRINLARILLRDSDILLLDEPTNHLDLESLEWLERFLRDYSGTIIIVSHDRVFLDRVVTRIIEIEEGVANLYSGNYSWYVEEKERRYISQLEQYERQQKEIKRIEDRAKWFVVQNRFTTKHHAILSRIDHMEKIDRPVTTRRLTAEFDSGGYAAKEILSIDSVSKSYDSNDIFVNLNLKINRNERIALIGANGCGKTTLLKMITGDVPVDSGQIKISSNVKLSYMSQIITFEDNSMSVLDTLRYATGVSVDKARNILAGFHFRADDVMKKISVLSGGEKSRLKLSILMQENVNFLLLDEPTNHLDIASREWIENALVEFNGTILFVSHDRYFLNKFADQVWSIDNKSITRYDCGFQEYLRITNPSAAQKEKIVKSTKGANNVGKGTVKGERQKTSPEVPISFEGLIHETEIELQEVDNMIELYQGQSDFKKLSSLYSLKSELEAKIETLYNEWVDRV